MSGADIIKMDYPMMEEMAQAFSQGSEQLEATIGEVNKIVGLIEGGGLIGVAGDNYVDACSSQLVPSLKRLQDKFVELQGDVLGAMQDMQSADSDTTRFYN